jgi:uncharacterized membrane protein
MRVALAIEVAAPQDVVWEFIADPRRYLHFMAGITRWEVAGHAVDDEGELTGDEESGASMDLGARFRTLMRVGSAEVGGMIEIVEADPPRDLAWNSVSGVDQRGRWRLRPRGSADLPQRTHVELRLSYGVAGAGLLGWLSERFSSPQVGANLRRSLQQLKRTVEHEQLRRAAAERRGARASA